MAVWKYVTFIVQLTKFILLKIGFKQVTQHLMSQCFTLKMIITGGIIPLDCLENWIDDTQKETCTICHELLIASRQFIDNFVTLKFNSTHVITFHDVKQNPKGHDPGGCTITFPYFVQDTQNLNTKKCSSKSENSPQPIFFQKMVIKGSEVQWHGGRIKVGHVEGNFFLLNFIFKDSNLSNSLSCFVPTG